VKSLLYFFSLSNVGREGMKSLNKSKIIASMSLIIFLILFFSFQNSAAIDYYQKGLYYENKKEFIHAIEYYFKAIEINPNFFDAYYHLALCYYTLEKYEEALDILKKSQKLEPENNDFMLLLAKVYVRLGNFKESEQIADDIISKSPTYLDAYFLKAEIKIYQGRLDEALDIYARLLRRYPDDWKVNLYLYRFYKSIDKEKEALQYIRKALDLAPYEPSIYEELAYYYFEKKDYRLTEEFLSRLFELEPNNASGYLLKSYMAIQNRDYSKALSYVETLYESYNSNLNILWLLSYIHLTNQNYSKSIEYLLKALSIFPYDEIVRYTLEEALVKANIMEFYQNKQDLAAYNYQWANFFFNNGYFAKGEIMLKRAIRLMPLDSNYRFKLSEAYKSKQLYFKQLQQYKILKDLGYSGIDLKIDLLNHALANSLEVKSKIEPYSIIDSFINVGIFSFPSDFREPHYNINSIFAEMLFDKFASIYGINFNYIEKDVNSLEEISNICKNKKLDYALLVEKIEPTPRDGYRVYIKIINPDNLYLLESRTFFASVDFPILEIASNLRDMILSLIPIRGKVVQAIGNTILINLGWANGITKDTEFIIINKNELHKIFNSIGYDMNSGVMGYGKVKELSETVTSLEVTKKDIYSKVNIGDYVFIYTKPKEK